MAQTKETWTESNKQLLRIHWQVKYDCSFIIWSLFFYCKNCRPLLGLLNLLSQYMLAAHNSIRPILLLLISYQICWILPCAWYKVTNAESAESLNMLNELWGFVLFSRQFHNPKFGFFFIALLLATVKAFGKNMADSWVAHDIFHSSIAYQRDQTVKIGLLSLDKCSSPWTYSPTTSGTIAHIMAK